ncbi:DUF1441 family protein [Arhodomonas sp. AD133]|uniref:DUF1441 family protein n=1 Tax=Arhodomonas sp. AD133 TaxID=3415009 RepID=UPI003EBE0765
MAEVSRLDEAYSWNISRIADAFGLHRDTVRKRLRAAGVAPVGTRNGAPLYPLKHVGPALFVETVPGVGEGGIDPDRLPPADRKYWYQSENERIRLERDLGELLYAEDAHQEMSRLAKAVVNTLEGLPDVLERDAGLPPEAIQRVQELMDATREQLYQAVIDDDGD